MRDHEVLTVNPEAVLESVPQEYRERFIELKKEGYLFLRDLGVGNSEAIARSTVWAELQTFIEIGREINSLEAKEKAKTKPRPLKKSAVAEVGKRAVARRPGGGMSETYRQRLAESLDIIAKAHECYRSSSLGPTVDAYQGAQDLIAAYMKRGKAFPMQFRQAIVGTTERHLVIPDGIHPIRTVVHEGDVHWIVTIQSDPNKRSDDRVYTVAPGAGAFAIIKNGLASPTAYASLDSALEAIESEQLLSVLGTIYPERARQIALDNLGKKLGTTFGIPANASERKISGADIAGGILTADSLMQVNPLRIEATVADAMSPLREVLRAYGKSTE